MDLVEQVLERLDVVERLRGEDGAVAAGLELDRVQVGGPVLDPVSEAGLLGLLDGNGNRLG